MNLLNQFVLQHAQVSVLHAELLRVSKKAGTQEAKVELNLTPRIVESEDKTALPAYQVTARLDCRGGAEAKAGPAFKALVGIEAVYQQVAGEAMDMATFTASHAELARQLYPMLQQEMRHLLSRMGLSQIQLPFDLAPRPNERQAGNVELSGSVH